MTREEAIARKAELEKKRDDLVDQIAAVDASSATVSSGSGSKSFTNRSVEELKAKVAFLDKQIARLGAMLGLNPPPGSITVVEVRFNG